MTQPATAGRHTRACFEHQFIFEAPEHAYRGCICGAEAAAQPAEAVALREARLWIVGVAPHLHEVFNHRLVKENGPGNHEACMHPDCQTARTARAALANQPAPEAGEAVRLRNARLQEPKP